MALNFVTGLGAKKKKDILEYYNNDIKTLFTIENNEFKKMISGRFQTNLITDRQKLLDKAEQELYKAEKLNIGITHLNSPDYPGNLLSIPDPPVVLYYKGSLSKADMNGIAIVGSRDATPYGLKNSHNLAYALAMKGITVISGLAKGIDGQAHQGTLAARQRTVAVLGSGIDKVFPKEHEKLHQQIAELGCLVSEFPIGSAPKSFHFPMRNRIIAGLSVGLVVVEGSKDSGSLYTAQYALEYGREIYAFPGPVQSYNYSGTHLLIKKGAKLIENSSDLLEDLSLVLDLDFLPDNKNYFEQKNTSGVKKNTSDLESINNKTVYDEPKLTLTEIEKQVLKHLSFQNKKPLDVIVEESGLRVEKIISSLNSLSLKGLCTQLYGSYYIRRAI